MGLTFESKEPLEPFKFEGENEVSVLSPKAAKDPRKGTCGHKVPGKVPACRKSHTDLR